MDITILKPDPYVLILAVVLDGLFGDPVYSLHPIRLIGATLSGIENKLRRITWDGYLGGCFLFILLSILWVGGISGLTLVMNDINPISAQIFHLFMLYSLIALKDLCKHGLAIDRAAHAGNLDAARQATSMLVGRDTAPMDAAACRRAGMESLSENAVDGFISPIFWYALLGLPGIVLFKVVSTMDSMVGFKTPRYFYFGWCGARLDDVLNLIPARLTYLLMVFVALFVPDCSARKAILIGWQQHAFVPGPNSGWSEATLAGALQCRMVGPIYQQGNLVTDLWLGHSDDPEGGQPEDMRRTCFFVVITCLLFTGIAAYFIHQYGFWE